MKEIVKGSVLPGFLDGGKWSACFGLSWTTLLLRDQALSQRIVRVTDTPHYMRKMAGTMGVADGRNELCRMFLGLSDAEWLFMIDTDMGFQPDIVDQLVASAEAANVPVMGGLCFAMKWQSEGPSYAARTRMCPTIYSYVRLDDGEQGWRPVLDYPRDTVMTAAGTGAACLLIHRDALAAVAEKYGPQWFQPITLATAGPGGTPRTFSEDLSFCVRLAACDIPLGVDTKAKTTHDKGGIFLDEETYDQQTAAATLAIMGTEQEAA